MKKILAALLTMVMMFQAFTFVTFAEGEVITVSIDVPTKVVSVVATGLEPDAEYSLRGYYCDKDAYADADFDYLDQVKADADGNASITYPSAAEDWEFGKFIYVILNNLEPGSSMVDYVGSIEITGYVGGMYTLRRGRTLDLGAVADNEGASLSYVSSDPSAASVSAEGIVKALKNKGMPLITVYAKDKDGNTVSANIIIQLAN